MSWNFGILSAEKYLTSSELTRSHEFLSYCSPFPLPQHFCRFFTAWFLQFCLFVKFLQFCLVFDLLQFCLLRIRCWFQSFDGKSLNNFTLFTNYLALSTAPTHFPWWPLSVQFNHYSNSTIIEAPSYTSPGLRSTTF